MPARLRAQGSVEDDVLGLQQKKGEMVRLAIGRRLDGDQLNRRLESLMKLFSIEETRAAPDAGTGMGAGA